VVGSHGGAAVPRERRGAPARDLRGAQSLTTIVAEIGVPTDADVERRRDGITFLGAEAALHARADALDHISARLKDARRERQAIAPRRKPRVGDGRGDQAVSTFRWA
jgi:hypothetical protein